MTLLLTTKALFFILTLYLTILIYISHCDFMQYDFKFAIKTSHNFDCYGIILSICVFILQCDYFLL